MVIFLSPGYSSRALCPRLPKVQGTPHAGACQVRRTRRLTAEADLDIGVYAHLEPGRPVLAAIDLVVEQTLQGVRRKYRIGPPNELTKARTP